MAENRPEYPRAATLIAERLAHRIALVNAAQTFAAVAFSAGAPQVGDRLTPDGHAALVGLVAAARVASPCRRCEGDGRLADTESSEPWKAWLDLPLKSAFAVTSGLVRPKPCPTCEGTGIATATPESFAEELAARV